MLILIPVLDTANCMPMDVSAPFGHILTGAVVGLGLTTPSIHRFGLLGAICTTPPAGTVMVPARNQLAASMNSGSAQLGRENCLARLSDNGNGDRGSKILHAPRYVHRDEV